MNASVVQLSDLMDRLPDFRRVQAESLIQQYRARGNLSGKQWDFVSGLIKIATTPKEAKPTTEIQNFSRILEIFDTARNNEYKAPKVRLGDKDYKIVLSEAGENSVNKGMIYVKVDGEYKGKISREGRWQVNGSHDAKLLKALTEFSMEPRETLKRFGFKTGTCAICGRKLTDKTSIANGIGPICQEGYGL